MIFGRQLDTDFFRRNDVTNMARELLGTVLRTSFDGSHTSGIIVETEAYRAPEDKASHAYNNRRTKRTETMFRDGGISYVYLCYGIHHLFNIVTATENVAHAILIRAIQPIEGEDVMLARRGMARLLPRTTAGPGSLTKALGINTNHNGLDLTDNQGPIWIEDPGIDKDQPIDIIASPRVGVDYAEECAAWPWRFRIRGSKWTSPAK